METPHRARRYTPHPQPLSPTGRGEKDWYTLSPLGRGSRRSPRGEGKRPPLGKAYPSPRRISRPLPSPPLPPVVVHQGVHARVRGGVRAARVPQEAPAPQVPVRGEQVRPLGQVEVEDDVEFFA